MGFVNSLNYFIIAGLSVIGFKSALAPVLGLVSQTLSDLAAALVF